MMKGLKKAEEAKQAKLTRERKGHKLSPAERAAINYNKREIRE